RSEILQQTIRKLASLPGPPQSSFPGAYCYIGAVGVLFHLWFVPEPCPRQIERNRRSENVWRLIHEHNPYPGRRFCPSDCHGSTRLWSHHLALPERVAS